MSIDSVSTVSGPSNANPKKRPSRVSPWNTLSPWNTVNPRNFMNPRNTVNPRNTAPAPTRPGAGPSILV